MKILKVPTVYDGHEYVYIVTWDIQSIASAPDGGTNIYYSNIREDFTHTTLNVEEVLVKLSHLHQGEFDVL